MYESSLQNNKLYFVTNYFNVVLHLICLQIIHLFITLYSTRHDFLYITYKLIPMLAHPDADPDWKYM